MSATPRTDAALARCGFADMAKMERELADALAELADLKNEIERTRMFIITPPDDGSDAIEWIMRLYRRSMGITKRMPPPEPETFEAHGHTWTRHTPGHPCPVPPNAMVHVMLRRELKGSMGDEVRPAANYEWGDYGGETWEIIGWRYAEKPMPPQGTAPLRSARLKQWTPLPPAKTVSEWADAAINPDAPIPFDLAVELADYQLVAGHLVVLPTAAECGQYADKHLAPSADDPATSIPKPLENQSLEDGEPVGNRTRDTLIKS